MKRHDTHLLSDESGNELKDGKDAHKYCFNNSNNSSNFSEEKLISKKSEHNSPKYLNINHLNQNINNVYKDKNDVTKKDISIISTKELEDIFCKENYNINNSQKKKKPKNNKYFIKLKKLKLNNENNEEIIDYFLTYNLALRNDYIDKKIVKNRNCISLNNKEKIIYKNNRAKFTKSKNLDDFKEKEILYFFYNDDSEGNKKLQKVINIINKTKLQLLKVSNSNFTIRTKNKKIKKKKNLPLLPKNNNKTNRNNNNYNINDNFDREVKIRKVNYSKIINHLNSIKLRKENRITLNNKKLILKSNNTLNITLKNQLAQTPSQSTNLKSNKKNEKTELLYNLYIGKQKNGNNKIQRVKSTKSESLFENKQKHSMWVSMNNYPDHKKYEHIHNNEKENRNLIQKLYKIKSGDSNKNYNIHFGNNDNCPLCQAIEQKRNEKIKKLGIFQMNQNVGTGNEKSKNSWQKRRVYSALSRILTNRQKKKRNSDNFNGINITRNRSRSKYRSKSKNKSKSKENKSKINLNNGNIFKKIDSKKDLIKSNNTIFRKLNINRSNYLQNNYSTTNKFFNTKNQSVKFN